MSSAAKPGEDCNMVALEWQSCMRIGLSTTRVAFLLVLKSVSRNVPQFISIHGELSWFLVDLNQCIAIIHYCYTVQICTLQSPTHPHGLLTDSSQTLHSPHTVLMESTWNLPRLYRDSMKSIWTPSKFLEVYIDSIESTEFRRSPWS